VTNLVPKYNLSSNLFRMLTATSQFPLTIMYNIHLTGKYTECPMVYQFSPSPIHPLIPSQASLYLALL